MDTIDAANGELHCTVANSGVLGNKKGKKNRIDLIIIECLRDRIPGGANIHSQIYTLFM